MEGAEGAPDGRRGTTAICGTEVKYLNPPFQEYTSKTGIRMCILIFYEYIRIHTNSRERLGS